LWPLEADEGQLGQVLNNLLLNADQAMPAGGTVTVEADNVTLADRSEVPLPGGRYVRVRVVDEGVGIAEELLPKIFDPYFTTKQKGSGLGLSTVYAIVRSHDGHVGVHSKPGAGATFTIHLPARPDLAAATEPAVERPCRGHGRILVMDDEESVRAMLGKMLVSLGFEACFATEGEEALRRYREALAVGRGFDAVILDLTVPGGLGGQETLQRLRESDPGVVALVSSGYSTDPVMAEYAAFGFRGVLTKPYTVAQLSEALRDIIAAAPAAAGSSRA
jgi:CheY-like chemotaxis protein